MSKIGWKISLVIVFILGCILGHKAGYVAATYDIKYKQYR